MREIFSFRVELTQCFPVKLFRRFALSILISAVNSSVSDESLFLDVVCTLVV